MGYTKYVVDIFDGTGDFGLWKQKMYSLLVQEDVIEAIAKNPKYPKDLIASNKKNIL